MGSRLWASIAGALALHGCVVFAVPGNVVQAAGDKLSGLGEHCINVHARVGDKVIIRERDTLKAWKVEAVTGPAPDRCRDPDAPIRARLSAL